MSIKHILHLESYRLHMWPATAAACNLALFDESRLCFQVLFCESTSATSSCCSTFAFCTLVGSCRCKRWQLVEEAHHVTPWSGRPLQTKTHFKHNEWHVDGVVDMESKMFWRMFHVGDQWHVSVSVLLDSNYYPITLRMRIFFPGYSASWTKSERELTSCRRRRTMLERVCVLLCVLHA